VQINKYPNAQVESTITLKFKLAWRPFLHAEREMCRHLVKGGRGPHREGTSVGKEELGASETKLMTWLFSFNLNSLTHFVRETLSVPTTAVLNGNQGLSVCFTCAGHYSRSDNN
jgi:hypothetical protein